MTKDQHRKAYSYFQAAEKLWKELAAVFPAYVQFQQYLQKVREDLADL